MKFNNGVIYTKQAQKWIKIDLDRLTVEPLETLPFPLPPPPSPPPTIRHSLLTVSEIIEDMKVVEGLRRLKGSVSNAVYERIWHNYAQLRDSTPQTGEESDR